MHLKIYLSVPALFLGIFAALSPSSVLQAQQPGLNEEPPQFSFRFRAMVWSGIGKGLYFMREEEKISFTATAANPSKWLEYRGSAPLYIYKEGETLLNAEGETLLNADGEAVPRPVARFIPQNNDDYLLVFSEDESSRQLRYRVFPLVETNEQIREGFRIVNFTKFDLAIAMNDEIALLISGESKLLQPKANEDTSIKVNIATKEGESVKIRYTNLLPAQPGIRSTVFILMPTDYLELRQFRDRVTSGN